MGTVVTPGNTFTDFLPSLYQALDIVSREMVGFIPAVTMNAGAQRAAIGETITFPIAPSVALTDNTPGLYAPDEGDQTITSATLSITKSKHASIRWAGEEQLGLGNTGQFEQVLRDQFAQAMRACVNEVEADLAGLYKFASRAYGVGGTTPFGTAGDFTHFAGVLDILDVNGAPTSDRHLVLGSPAIANIRGLQSVLFKANEAGTDELLRQGIIGNVMGLNIHNSAQVKTVTIGTGTGYQMSGSFAAGVTTIAIDTGTGTVLDGDVVVLNSGDANQYVVKTGVTAAGSIVLNGQKGALKAGADNATLFKISTAGQRNMCFHRSAIQLVVRPPMMPAGGDAATDVTEVTDPISGLTFQVAMYRQYRRVKIEVGLAWGVAAVKSDHIALLLG
jgi:P22 coat protein - gene protein 5